MFRVPEHRGVLVIYDPDTEGYNPDVHDCMVVWNRDILGCARQGWFNGIPATETLGQDGSGSFYRTVRYDACGNSEPAGLVAHYEDASWKTRRVFDEILTSVRK
jgi:hypothetical protein